MLDFKIVSSDLNYKDINELEFSKLKDLENFNSWKNDVHIIHIIAKSKKSAKYKLLSNHGEYIKSKIYTVHYTKAFNGNHTKENPLDRLDKRAISYDMLIENNRIFFEKDKIYSFYIEVEVKKEANYFENIDFIFSNDIDKNEFSKNIKIIVKDKIVNINNDFQIELWQYPYSVAEYYGVKKFSKEHFEILEKHFLPYKEIGGNFITATLCEEAWGGQTYSKNEIKYPSMIKWIKEDEKFIFDYTDFDKWIDFVKLNNMGEKIIVYGIAPWHESFTYYEDGKLIFEKYDVNSSRYKEVWNIFLNDFLRYLKEKNIFENIYLGIDERGFNEKIFETIDSIRDLKGNRFKISGAINNIQNQLTFSDCMEHVSVALIEFEKNREKFYEFVDKRRERNQTTMLYSCTDHKPGNFSLSQPGETYYTILNTAFSDGFLRWAYDAWVENPIYDSTHRYFESGDCFLVYPSIVDDKKTNQSIRMLKIKEAIYDVYKLRELSEYIDVKENLNNLDTKFIQRSEYMSDSEIEILIKDIENIKSMF